MRTYAKVDRKSFMHQRLKPNLLSVCCGITILINVIGIPATGNAAYINDVDYDQLQAELGTSIPDGTGVAVTQIEAMTNHPVFCPSPNPPCAYAPSSGSRTITDGDGGAPVVEPFSGHAGSVGSRFYGDTSTTPGIGVAPSPSISAYAAVDWLQSGFIRSGTSSLPAVTPSRVANHSYIASFGNAAIDLEILRRIDWLVETDDYIQVVGFVSTQPLLGSAYNVIGVRNTGAPEINGTALVSGDTAYAVERRTRPDIVAPEQNLSNATPRIASAVALLIDTARSSPSLSNGSTANRYGDTIYSAGRSEVIKAALMAGADRATINTSPEPPYTLGDITDYRVDISDRTANSLDRRYGAGQQNIFNSYHIIAAGEQDSDQDDGVSGTGQIGVHGFDYDPAFGGLGSNSKASYFFSTGAEADEFTASLVWNIEIDPGPSFSFDRAATLYDLDLSLYEVINPDDSDTWVLISDSKSTTENTENIWASLVPGKDYALQVTSGINQSAFDWDYGLAWQITAATNVQKTNVPNIVDQVQTTAETNIVAAGLTVGAVTAVNSDTVPAGNVISQSPAACTECALPGSRVDLVMSSGPAPIDVPNLAGQAQATAEANLVAAGLTVGVVTKVNSDTVPAGNVISQNPAACTGCVLPGAQVDLVLSSGPDASSGGGGGSSLNIYSLTLMLLAGFVRRRKSFPFTRQ